MFKLIIPGTEITGIEAREKYGLTDVAWAEEFSVGENSFIVYFDTCKQKDGCYVLSFAAIGEMDNPLIPKRALLSHRLTGNNIGYVAILSKVLDVLVAFLEMSKPKMVSFSGTDPRQQKFYNKILEKLPVPAQYAVERRGDLLVIATSE